MSDLRSQASTWRTSRHTWLVHSDAANEDFSFKVSGAFTIIGRGTILVGDIESGLMRSGDSLEVCDEQGVIFVGAATVDFVCRPGWSDIRHRRAGLSRPRSGDRRPGHHSPTPQGAERPTGEVRCRVGRRCGSGEHRIHRRLTRFAAARGLD